MTNHNRPDESDTTLEELRRQFDEELASLRAPDAGARLREVFASTPEELADAANGKCRR